MKVRFESPSELTGSLRVPASKSYTHRAYLTALLSGGGRVGRPLASEDTDATLGCLERFEGQVRHEADAVTVEAGLPPRIETDRFEVGESGTLLRFLVPLCTVCEGPDRVVLEGRGTLKDRSNRSVVASMREAGFRIEADNEAATVPLTCFPNQPLPDEPVPVSGRTTSQIVSGWLLGLAAAGGGRLRLQDELVSAPYVEMTARVLRRAGIEVTREEAMFTVDPSRRTSLEYTVPGDYSSAAFLLVGAATAGREVHLHGLDPEDPQADRRIVDLLRRVGVEAAWTEEDEPALRVHGPTRPEGFRLDAVDCPDLVPVLAVLGCAGSGTATLTNLGHLTNKESDRLHATARELRRAGVNVETGEERMVVHPDGGNPDRPVTLDAHGDHRLAMAFSVLGLRRGNLVVDGAECVAKSYPGFFGDLRALGARFEVEREGSDGKFTNERRT